MRMRNVRTWQLLGMRECDLRLVGSGQEARDMGLGIGDGNGSDKEDDKNDKKARLPKKEKTKLCDLGGRCESDGNKSTQKNKTQNETEHHRTEQT